MPKLTLEIREYDIPLLTFPLARDIAIHKAELEAIRTCSQPDHRKMPLPMMLRDRLMLPALLVREYDTQEMARQIDPWISLIQQQESLLDQLLGLYPLKETK